MADQPDNQPDPSAQPTSQDQDASSQADLSVDQVLDEAKRSLEEIGEAVGGSASSAGGAGEGESGIELLSDVDLNVMIELGRTEMLVEDVLQLSQGSVVELDKLAGDPVDVHVNGRLVARGEVLVLNDNFCIRISEIVADLEEEAEAAINAQEPARAVRKAGAAEAQQAATAEGGAASEGEASSEAE